MSSSCQKTDAAKNNCVEANPIRHKSLQELDNISRAFEIRFSFRSIYAVVDYANISGLHLDDAAGGGGVGGDRFGPADEKEGGGMRAISAH